MKSNDLCCFKCGGLEVTITTIKNVLGGDKESGRCDYCGAYVPIYEKQLSHDYKMRFGKYKGQRLGDIPRDYLEWLHSTVDDRSGFKHHIQKVLGR